MRRISLFAALALTSVFALAIVNVNHVAGGANRWIPAGHDHGQHQQANHRSDPNRQQQQPFVDGAVNPNAVPDSAGREIVLRLLTSDDLPEVAKRAYLKEVGFDEAASAALTLAAYDFKRQTAEIEKEASDIKDRTWPTPDKETSEYLAILQRQKEEILINNAAVLEERLRNFSSLANWERLITNRVKRKTKGFQIGMPVKKIGFYQKILDPFAAFAQASGCDAMVWVYSDTYVSWEDMTVYGVTSYSVPANNCGHTFSPSAITWAITAGQGGYGNSIPLNIGSTFIDGLFHTNSDLEGYCPVANQNFYAGNNASDMTLAPYLTVNPFGNFNPTSVKTIQGSSVSGLQMSVTGSQSATGSFNVEFSYTIVQGAPPVNIFITGSGNKTILGGQTIPVTAIYSASSITSNPTKIRARAKVTSSMQVERGDQTSASILTITP